MTNGWIQAGELLGRLAFLYYRAIVFVLLGMFLGLWREIQKRLG